MKKRLGLYVSLLSLVLCSSCSKKPDPIIPKPKPEEERDDSIVVDTICIERATMVWEATWRHYWIENESRVYGVYPHKESNDYWVKYAAVWGYGAFLSAYNTLYQHTPDYVAFRQTYEDKVWKGLDQYWNEKNGIPAYGAYMYNDGRFYDDNVWVGIDLIELYDQTKDAKYLNKAKAIWRFIMSGMDDRLGGGVYWKEEWGADERPSKNTCSNAPVAVFGMKLYNSTQDETYRSKAAEIYGWTKKTLQDPSDKLYWDNIKVDNGEIEKWKFSYNVGQMLQASVLLYNVYKTEAGGDIYLKEARELAEAAFNHYCYDLPVVNGEIKMLEAGDLWFHAIMFRGFAEFYKAELGESDKAVAKKYIEAFKKMLDYAWTHARDTKTHLFNTDLSGATKDKDDEGNPSLDLRTEGAIIEMYARIAALNG